MKQQKSSGGNRKIGRNKGKCERYRNEHRRDKSKLKNFIKHNIPANAIVRIIMMRFLEVSSGIIWEIVAAMPLLDFPIE